MIIKFSNLGKIEETELDLRPLTVIIGPNNSNKTYIAYSIYGLLLYGQASIRGVALKFKHEQDGALSLNLENGLKEFIAKDSKENVVQFFKRRLATFFQDSSGQLFAKTSFDLDFSTDDITSAVKSLKTVRRKGPHGDLVFSVSLKENTVLLRLLPSKIDVDQGKRPRRDELFFPFIFTLKKTLYPAPYLLPAERNAFVLTYKLLVNRRYAMLRETQRELFGRHTLKKAQQLELLREQGDIGYPEPLERFLELLPEIELETSRRNNLEKKNKFQELADQVEQHIQDQNRTILTPTKFGKEIKVHVKPGLDIDLYNASSAIKQLAPLLLYLRYRAAKNQLLIIDEPEMNLHPESQAKLLEVLGILVNLGIKVLITTHSPYFMAHLNNLVNGKTNNPKVLKKQSSSLFLSDPRAFLRLDQVSAYEMKDNKLVSLKDKDYGIRWDTLSDVSAELQRRYFEIYESGKSLSHAKKK